MKALWKVTGMAILALALASPLLAQDLVMFSYQGFVKVRGDAYNGTGEFKFAIVSASGHSTLWSNDMQSVGGLEPVQFVPISVTDGVFQVMIGDPAAGMSPINRVIFNQKNLKLRVWFNDGEHGFQHMTPDTKLMNLELLAVKSDTGDFTVFVNGATGDDENDGLTATTAKRTVGGAVNMLPSRIRCNITIDVADGVYREQVTLFGIVAEEGKFVRLVGDEDWTPTSTEPPTVRVTGTDVDTTVTTPIAVRPYGFIARHCSGIQIKGFLADYASNSGFYIGESTVHLANCQASHNVSSGGIVYTTAAYGSIRDCATTHNERFGYLVANYSGPITAGTVIGNYNKAAGFMVGKGGRMSFAGVADMSHNDKYGLVVSEGAHVLFDFSNYAGTISYNGVYGLVAQFDSFTVNHTRNTITNNGTLNIYTASGGNTYTSGGVSGI